MINEEHDNVMQIILLFGCTLCLGGGALSQQSPATSINKSVLATDAERYLVYAPSDTAEELIAAHRGYDMVNDTFVVGYHPREEVAGRLKGKMDRLHEMKRLAWNSDAIMLGTPTRRVSALTASHRFVFSDYEITVSSVIRDSSKQLLNGSQIVVTRPGGDVKVGSVGFRAIETEMPLFKLGTPYLLFLHFNEDVGTYSVAAADVFAVANDQILSAKTHPVTGLEATRKQDFLNNLKVVADADKRGER